jgi:chaperonin GroEL
MGLPQCIPQLSATFSAQFGDCNYASSLFTQQFLRFKISTLCRPRKSRIPSAERHCTLPQRPKKDRVDDALNATKAAVEEGILPGGGAALLYATKALKDLAGDNDDQNQGIAIVRRAIQSPIRQIVENSGVEASIVVGKLLEQKSNTFGFDAQSEKYVDLVEAGIVDPTKVVRIALQDASSVAALLITTEAMVADRPKKEAAPMPGGGGMGGMGDMDF